MKNRKAKKRKIFKRDNKKCLCCGKKTTLTLDHVIPKSLGGTDTYTNLQLLCEQCNLLKSSRIQLYTNHPRVVRYVQRFINRNQGFIRPELLIIGGKYKKLIKIKDSVIYENNISSTK